MFFFSGQELRAGVERDACVGRALGYAWPEGVPNEELRHARSLSASRAARTAPVLAAVLLAERMGSAAPHARIADRFGLGRTTFYRYRKAWAARRSLSSITAYEGRAPRLPSDGEPERRARVAARAAMVADQACSNGAIARAVLDEHGEAVPRSLNTIVKLVQLERRAMMLDPTSLGKTYGRSLLFDYSALSNGVVVGGTVVPMVAAFIVERGAGLVIGYAAGSGGDEATLFQRAAVKALAFLAREFADLEGDEVAVVFSETKQSTSSWRAAPSYKILDLSRTGMFRAGGKLMSLIGPRLGTLALMPRHTSSSEWPERLTKPRGQGPYALDNVDAVVGDAVALHNAPILALLREDGLLKRGRPHGGMAKAIEMALG